MKRMRLPSQSEVWENPSVPKAASTRVLDTRATEPYAARASQNWSQKVLKAGPGEAGSSAILSMRDEALSVAAVICCTLRATRETKMRITSWGNLVNNRSYEEEDNRPI